MSESPYQPGVYVKGDDERVARSASQAVALAFDGYRLKSESTESTAAPAPTVSDTAPVKDTPTPSPKALAARQGEKSQEDKTQ